MRNTMLFAVLFLSTGTDATSWADAGAPATYHVKLLSVKTPKLKVTADIPIEGQKLVMDTTRPAGIPELDAGGWPALVSKLRVTDPAGGRIEATRAGEAGWTLSRAPAGRVKVTYEVSYAALAKRGWPAPREAALADPGHLVLVCRSIFITTPQVRESVVDFELPKDWAAVTPWEPRPESAKAFAVLSYGDLVENLLVMTPLVPEIGTAGAFRLLVVPMGPWLTARREVLRVLGSVIPRLVDLMGAEERENYLVVLLPVLDQGAESYRRSFALTLEVPPSRANSALWGNLIAHEIFHLWNGWRLRGTDYPSSQWFQEGFTEYAANVAVVNTGLIDADEFLQKLSDHVKNYGKLVTTLEGSGSHKGPPLYSAGALVAFSWDVQIRQATDGKRGFSDLLKALWKQTNHGRASYAWPDIEAALTATAPFDWEAYYQSFIRGNEPLPLDGTFASAGLRLVQAEDGTPRVTIDPTASAASKALFRALIDGN